MAVAVCGPVMRLCVGAWGPGMGYVLILGVLAWGY